MSRAARRQVFFVCLFLVVVLLFVTTYRMGVVRGESMTPTYQNGQVVLVRRRNWFSAPLHHNDVVLLRKDREVLIKRIYRLPGEEITDSVILRSTYAFSLADFYEQQPAKDGHNPIPRLFVPEGYLMVLGDNPRVSEDSRLFGPIPIRDVLGVVVAAPPPPANEAPAPPGSAPPEQKTL